MTCTPYSSTMIDMAGISFDVQADTRTFDADIDAIGVETLRANSAALKIGHKQYLVEHLDSPTPFTLDTHYTVRTTAGAPEFLVGIKDDQAGYLT